MASKKVDDGRTSDEADATTMVDSGASREISSRRQEESDVGNVQSFEDDAFDGSGGGIDNETEGRTKRRRWPEDPDPDEDISSNVLRPRRRAWWVLRRTYARWTYCYMNEVLKKGSRQERRRRRRSNKARKCRRARRTIRDGGEEEEEDADDDDAGTRIQATQRQRRRHDDAVLTYADLYDVPESLKAEVASERFW